MHLLMMQLNTEPGIKGSTVLLGEPPSWMSFRHMEKVEVIPLCSSKQCAVLNVGKSCVVGHSCPLVIIYVTVDGQAVCEFVRSAVFCSGSTKC